MVFVKLTPQKNTKKKFLEKKKGLCIEIFTFKSIK